MLASAEHGDQDQACNTDDVVVLRRDDAGVFGWRDSKDSGCQRRDGHRQAQPEDPHRRHYLGEVVAGGGEADE